MKQKKRYLFCFLPLFCFEHGREQGEARRDEMRRTWAFQQAKMPILNAITTATNFLFLQGNPRMHTQFISTWFRVGATFKAIKAA